jgi:hypothetical protein
MVNERKKVSQAIVEATYGAGGVFAPGDALLTRNAKVKPLQGDVIERPLDLPSYGARPKGFANRRNGFEFEIEMAGGGLNTTAPKWMSVLNRACGLGAPVSSLAGGQHMEQGLLSSDGLSCAFNINIDGLLHPQRGARGTFGWTVTANEIPYFGYTMTGLPPAGAVRTAVAQVVPDYAAFVDPVPASPTNTMLTVDGYTVTARSFTGQMSNNTPFRNLFSGGQPVVRLTNREISGSMVIEDPDTAKDFIAIADSRTPVLLAFQHGTVSGNIVTMSGTKVLLDLPEDPYSNEDDTQMMTINWTALITAGNDEWLFGSK